MEAQHLSRGQSVLSPWSSGGSGPACPLASEPVGYSAITQKSEEAWGQAPPLSQAKQKESEFKPTAKHDTERRRDPGQKTGSPRKRLENGWAQLCKYVQQTGPNHTKMAPFSPPATSHQSTVFEGPGWTGGESRWSTGSPHREPWARARSGLKFL